MKRSGQYFMYAGFAFMMVVMFGIGTELFKGFPAFVPAILPIVVSIVGMPAIRLVVEGTGMNGMFNPKTQSWAFMFGDLLSLPVALFCVAMAREKTELSSWTVAPWWYVIAALIGIAAGSVFHFVMDTRAYRKQHAERALVSPTKIWHDFVVYPVLFGVLIWAGAPLLLSSPQDWSVWTWAALAAIVSWFVLGMVCDGKRQPRAYDMHPAWSTRQFAVAYPS